MKGRNMPLLTGPDPKAQASKTRGRRKQAGQSLLEVALMTPLLLAMIIGTIEFGRYIYIGILVGNAARAGAAFGAQNPGTAADAADIATAAKNDFQNNGQAVSKLTVASSFACGCDNAGTVTAEACTGTGAGTCSGGAHWIITVTVEASGTFNSLFSFPGIPANLTLDRSCTLRVNSL